VCFVVVIAATVLIAAGVLVRILVYVTQGIWRTVITRCCFAASATNTTNTAITDGGGIGAWPAVLQAVPVSIVPMSVPAPAPSNLNSFYLQKGTTTTTTTTRLNNDFFQLFRHPTSDLPDNYTPTRSPTTKRLLKLSGSGLNGRSPICTPFPIASLIPAPIPVMPSLLAENAMLRAKLYQAERARHASEERCSEVEKENAGYVDVLTETMAFLEHRSAVHKARVAALEQEVAGQAKVQRDQAEALEQLGAGPVWSGPVRFWLQAVRTAVLHKSLRRHLRSLPPPKKLEIFLHESTDMNTSYRRLEEVGINV
jgi:hypothetical protein